jgi:hypothetical protein
LAKKVVLVASLTLVTVALTSAAFCGEILKAAREDKLEIVKALLNVNPDLISSRDSHGLTLLHLVAGTGQSASEAAPKATPDAGPPPALIVPTPRAADSAPRAVYDDAAALTDAQIEAAIQRGFGSSVAKIADHAYSVRLNKFDRILVTVEVLSDSDRIALAASAASHDINKHGAASPKHDFSFSVQDARASAIRLGVVTVAMLVNGEGPHMDEKLKKWVGQRALVGSAGGLQVMLNVDGKIIRPMTNAQYFAFANFDFAKGIPRAWQASDYYRLVCRTGSCTALQFTFPVIEGVQNLTLVMIGADGVHLEKELDPKRFMSR